MALRISCFALLRGIRFTGHITYITELRHKFSVLAATRGASDNFETLSIGWRIILKWIILKWNIRLWRGFI
jgi:hypothetical protein